MALWRRDRDGGGVEAERREVVGELLGPVEAGRADDVPVDGEAAVVGRLDAGRAVLPELWGEVGVEVDSRHGRGSGTVVVGMRGTPARDAPAAVEEGLEYKFDKR